MLAGCGEETSTNSDPIVIRSQRTGPQLYVSCQACHAQTGSGIQGMAPPLVNSQILASNDHIITVLRNGYKSGRQYAAIMTGFDQQFSNEEMVTLVNWMRSNWSPASSDMTLEHVQKLRARPLLGRQAAPTDLQ